MVLPNLCVCVCVLSLCETNEYSHGSHYDTTELGSLLVDYYSM